MAGILDLIDQGRPAEPAPAPEPTLGETFGQGLRSGAYDARGKLNKVAGTVMDHVGLDGSGRNAASLRDKALAQAEGQDLVPFADADFGKQGLRWASGALGSMVPMAGAAVGAGLLTGGGAVPAMLAGTAVQAPVELGDMLQRQDNDPTNLHMTPGERLGAAALPALGSAAVGNIIPAGVAARMMGKTAPQPLGRVAARGLADIPANYAAEAGAEGIRQVGDNVANPNAGYNIQAMKDAGAEGAVMGAGFGAAGAAGHALHSSGAAIKALPGKAIDAAKALVPESAKKRAGEAADAAQDVSGEVATWAEGTIQKRADDVRAWGRDFMADEAAPDSFKAKVQEALRNPGDAANQAWMATEKFARDTAAKTKAAVNEADVPTKLRKLYADGKAKADDVLDRMTRGEDLADPAAPDQVVEQGRADQTAFQKATQWASELADENLSPDNAAKLKQAAPNLSDKANQMTVAGLKKGQDTIKSMRASAKRFSDAVNAKVDADKGTVKKSEDYSGANKAIGDSVKDILGPDHPAFNDTEVMNTLADGLRTYIGDVASGKALDSFSKLDHLEALHDVLGDQTTDVLAAVHKAVSGASKDEAAAYKSLKQIDDVLKGRQGLQETLTKNLRPELQGVIKAPELRKEAAMLSAWAERKVKDPGDVNKAALEDSRIRRALETRYGDKADVVLKAVEKNMKHEENMLDLAETSERTTEDGMSSVHYYAQNKQLYLHPDKDKGGTTKDGVKYDGAATQRMRTAERDNPGASVQFRKASEIGLDDPMVKAKHADLMDEARSHGLDDEQAKDYADKRIDDFGVVSAEKSKQETAINPGELARVRLDAKHFSKSPARIDAGDGVIIDAIKLTDLMQGKLKDQYTTNDDAGRNQRTANMFKEGIAALQDHLGRTFDVPDSTRIAKSGLTWGEAQELDVRTGADKASDATTEDINALRKEYREATTAAERKKIAGRGRELAGEKEWAVIQEQLSDEHDARAPKVKANEDGVREITRNTREDKREGEADADLTGNVHAALKGGENTDAVVRTNNDGSARADTVMGRRKPAKSVEETPDPKAVAAKQAAFTEKARSGDQATKDAVARSDDTKGLQRAVEHLNSLKDAGHGHVADMIDHINGRIAQLILEPGVAYGMQTKRYSLMSTAIHDERGAMGFAATHDSPIKHEGKFDWRNNGDRGAGQLKGAGTYLSTSDTVHGYYKGLFSEQAVGELNKSFFAESDEGYKKPGLGAGKSPTYHLSVDIPPSKLLNWDRPLSEQPPSVRLRAMKAMKDNGLDVTLAERGEDFYRALSEKLGSDREASDLLQSLGILGHEMKGAGRDGKPNYVVYDDSKITTNYVHFSQERADPNASGPRDFQAAKDHIEKVLGPNVKVLVSGILHAGEFDRTAIGDVIRLSVHALNPTSVAYHESLHGFMARLRDDKMFDVGGVLEKAGSGAVVMNQLKKLLAHEPDALKQLNDPEERAAYMYQFWAQGKLTVGPETHTLFQKIAKFLREVTGMWTNDEHAEKVLNYFHSGEYEANRSNPSAVHRTLMESDGRTAIQKLKAATEPLREMGEALASAGGARLRDTGIPALRELADTMKLKTTTEGQDAGYLPAARAERSRIMNSIGTDLKPYSKEVLAEALDQLQTGVKAQSLAARTAAKIVGKRLDEALKYMQGAGVRIDALDMKDGVPYFPRAWDASYISGHQRQFLAMLDKYVQTGELIGDPKTLMQKLMVTDGGEFTVETDKPGMQNAKQRVLSFISHADAATFMRKDMHAILNSYVTQATRRAEWARRFGDDGKGVTALLDKAKQQGATKEQLDTAQKFVRSVDGTLGDTINPTARRMMGNMIVYQNIRLLPLAIFSSAVDAQGIMVRGGTTGEAFKTFMRGMKEVKKNFQKDPKDDRMTQLAETLGVIDSAMLVHTLGASYSQGMVGNKGRAINDTFFRFNLMEQYNTSMRVGATEAAMNFLVRHATKPGEHSTRFLRELGLDASDVHVDGMGRPKLLESDGLSLEHSAKMKAAINRWVDGAVLRPDAVDKPIWMSDPHFALVAHLKQFVFSFHETILKRVAHEAANGNYSPAMSLASYVPMMIAADALKGLIQGGGEQPDWKDDWGPGDYAWSGMERAGLFGVGQFGIDAASGVGEHGALGVFDMLGPTVEQLTDGLQVMGGRAQFGAFALKSMPANALYATTLHGEATDPKFTD